MNAEIIEAITQIAKDKRIDKDNLRDILEGIFLNMIQKKFGTTENFDVIVNIDKGDIEVYQEKTVVEKVEDPVTQIDLESAKKIDPDAEIGEEIVEVIDPKMFGRRLIASAKQNLAQKIRDFERESVIEEYKNRIGEIIIGDIHQINNRGIYINQDKTEVFLPRSEKIPTEILRRGQTVRCIIKEVREDKKGHGPEIIVSRADKQFLMRLFELEVPEIYDGIVEIKAVARDPGERAKIAVESIDRRIDAVGACVGMKGSRIHGIVRELRNENIDVINYTTNTALYIQRALSPATISSITLDDETMRAEVYMRPDQVSLAIGKGGYNIKLAGKLTGYEIDVYRDTDVDTEDVDLKEFNDEIDQWIIDELKAVGCDTAKSVLELSVQELVNRTDLEEETINEVVRILKAEFE